MKLPASKLLKFLLSLSVIFSGSIAGILIAKYFPRDKKLPRPTHAALLALADANRGSRLYKSWHQAEEKRQPICTWEGVVCHEKTGDVIELHLSKMGIKVLPDRNFDGLERLLVLDLSGNEIAGFTRETFVYLDLLHDLNLSRNLFTRIGDEDLFAIIHLRDLDLSQNPQFHEMRRDALLGFHDLKRVNLQGTGLSVDMVNVYRLRYKKVRFEGPEVGAKAK